MTDNKPPHLPLDVLNVIAGISPIPYYDIRNEERPEYASEKQHSDIFRLMLNIPRFARSVLYMEGRQDHWQKHFTVHGNYHRGLECHILCTNTNHTGPKKGGSIDEWSLNGKLHRVDGPAYVHYVGNGIMVAEKWYRQGKLHRINGPAFIFIDLCMFDFGVFTDEADGNRTKVEAWYKYNQLHREGGPAVVRSHGKDEYWINGKQIEEQ
jgi:hypothetical protein